MEPWLACETRGLTQSWMRHDQVRLRDYLVQDVQDPRLNVASILGRHFLIRGLFPGRFAELMRREIRFGIVANALLALTKSHDFRERLDTACAALVEGPTDGSAGALPAYVFEAASALPAWADGVLVPDYLRESLAWLSSHAADLADCRPDGSTFERLWRDVLAREDHRPVRVLEPACGSANDYRFIDAFGIARFLDYAGFDLCEKNKENARAMFPGITFNVGNVLQIDAPDKSFDYCFVHDLFEHLSIEAMEVAVAEICRVTRRGLLVGFFRMHEGAEHIVFRCCDYHINSLSAAGVGALFRRRAADVRVTRIDTMLRQQFGCPDTPNPNAYVLEATF